MTSPAAARTLPAMSITATVKNGTITLPPGLDVPDGTRVEVVVLDPPPGTLPPGYLERVAGALADEPFERPEQGECEERSPW